MAAVDRGYTILLTQLHRPSNTFPLAALQASITHFIAELRPSPTPLAAAVVSSLYFQPFSLPKLHALCDAFRHAAHLKARTVKSNQPSIFTPSIRAQLRSWAAAVIKGLQGGHPVIKLASCSGLLLGLDDITHSLPGNQRGIKDRSEDELLLTIAEVIDLFSYRQSFDNAEKGFESATEDGEVDALALALIVSSRSLLLIPSEKMAALPLASLLRLVMHTITSAFQFGTFLSSLQLSLSPQQGYKAHLPVTAPIRSTIMSIASSPVIMSMGTLSNLCARTLSIVIDRQPKQHMNEILGSFEVLESIATQVDIDWSNSILSEGLNENSIAPDTRDIVTSLWNILKTLLFATIMITESALSTIVFLPPSALQDSLRISPITVTSTPQLPSTCALISLHTLSHLSFIISQFGGVTSTATGGFVELKKAFYAALDVLAADPIECNRFVRGLCDSIKFNGDSPVTIQRGKQAFALTCIEQLIPILDSPIIEDTIFPLCFPLLSDSAHRETYESAHSVVLAILASTQNDGQKNVSRTEDKSPTHEGDESNMMSTLHNGFVTRIVPFYVGCLLENSVEGKLSTAQLCLAYAALVRSPTSLPENSQDDQHALAWFCIDALLTKMHSISRVSTSPASSSPIDLDRLHRLRLTLISCVPCLPLVLLPRSLDAVRNEISSAPATRRQELVNSLFAEIAERVGDKEKEFTFQWWIDNHRTWQEYGFDSRVESTRRSEKNRFGRGWWTEPWQSLSRRDQGSVVGDNQPDDESNTLVARL